jgi:hypothetical protein
MRFVARQPWHTIFGANGKENDSGCSQFYSDGLRWLAATWVLMDVVGHKGEDNGNENG